jgi:hypothetical protein
MARRAGNGAKLVGRHGVASYQLNWVAAVACRTCHQPDLGVVSANECHGDLGRLEVKQRQSSSGSERQV